MDKMNTHLIPGENSYCFVREKTTAFSGENKKSHCLGRIQNTVVISIESLAQSLSDEKKTVVVREKISKSCLLLINKISRYLR